MTHSLWHIRAKKKTQPDPVHPSPIVALATSLCQSLFSPVMKSHQQQCSQLCLLLTLTATDTCQISPTTPSFVLLVQALQILACMNTFNHEDNHLTSKSERGRSHSVVHFPIILFFYSTFPSLLCWSFADDTLQWHFLILDRAGGSTILFVSVICLFLDFSTLIPWLERKKPKYLQKCGVFLVSLLMFHIWLLILQDFESCAWKRSSLVSLKHRLVWFWV